MADADKLAALRIRASLASHAIQSGVAMDIESGGQAATPKHLRVGVDTAKAEQAGFAQLLIRKGLITEVEYVESVVLGLEAEKTRYEKYLSDKLGANITLA